MTQPSLPLGLAARQPDELTIEHREVVRRGKSGRLLRPGNMWRWRCACRATGRWTDDRDGLVELHADHVLRTHTVTDSPAWDGSPTSSEGHGRPT